MAQYAFEVPFKEIQESLDIYVAAIFSSLESEFLIMPKGEGFVEYPVFEEGYETLKRATEIFQKFTPDIVYKTTLEKPVSMIVLRTMMGFTPPEWAYIATQHSGAMIDQGFARTLDRRIRMNPLTPLSPNGENDVRLKAMIQAACEMFAKSCPAVTDGNIHRLDKADTRNGLDSLQHIASMGVPYAMLLYERYLGRPFAGHRDSVSELIGDRLESAIEDVLSKAGISFRKTKRAERLPGFDQAPDFVIPSEFNPKVIIEAKITEDDGTARDKVTRIQHLGELSLRGQPANRPKYEVIACIAGRGFGIRREDMKKMLLATRGKVFTLKTLNRLVECTQLKKFKTK
ncbi:MAG: hypothetical protein HYZ73_06895 [Elusimicrobia bacterium]|nr:hypothetical protein [Elusimicrobiota bacterium]